jgi:hypothetical protein
MKKLLYCAAALATMFFAGSCQRENFEPAGKGGAVTFTVTAPGELDTRATTIANGENVNVVHYAVYKTNPNEDYSIDDSGNIDGPLAQGVVPMNNKTASVELDLLQDQAYTILFWAQKSENLDQSDKENYGKNSYYYLGDLREVFVKYEEEQIEGEDVKTIPANDESRAAFFQRYDFNTESAQNYEVKLVRPFAQINLGTTLASLKPVQEGQTQGYEIGVKESEMTVKGIASSFSLVTGKGKDEAVDFTFTSTATPATANEQLFVNDTEYHYVGMNYLVIPIEDKTVTVSYGITTDKGNITNTINNVPVKENFRTNIIGNLLTSKTDFEIVVDERFNEPDKIVGVWDGVETQEPSIVNGCYEIYTAANWAWLKGKNLNGNNIRLMGNVDFAGHIVKGLGFTGEFDGNGYTMSNLVLAPGGSNYSNGLFQGDASGEVTVKDLTIKNVVSKCADPAQGYAGVIFGDVQENVTLSNVHIYNAVVEGVQSVGGLVGFLASGKTLTLNGCSVNDSELSNIPVVNESGFVAGLVGRVVGTVSFDAATKVNDISINAYYAKRRGESSIQPTLAYNVASNTAQAANSNVKIIKHALADNQVTVTSQAEFAAALENGGLILLGQIASTKAEGTSYLWKPTGKNVEVIGMSEGISVDFTSLSGDLGNDVYFENLTLNFSNNFYTGFHHSATEIYKNCVVNGNAWTYAPKAEFEGCSFDQRGDAYNVWIYGPAVVEFKNCDFTSFCKSILIYSETSNEYDVTIDGCSFYAENNDGKAAVQMHTEAGIKGKLSFTNTTVSGNYADINGGFYNEINKSTGLATTNFKVTIDGYEIVAPGVTKKGVEYNVSTAAGLAYMNDSFKNKTAGRDVVLNLTADIDFTGHAWTPVDSHADSSFEIAEINGNGHTLSNLTINGQAMFTRFAGSGNVVVKDITFDNASINSNGNINTSILTVQTYQNVLLDNVDVKNSTIIGGYKVAPLMGTVYNENPSTITAMLKNCDVDNVTVKATSYDFCTTGMVAFVHAGDNDAIEFENCTVKNVKLYAPNVYTAHAAIYTTGSDTLFNEAEGVTIENVTFENI